MEQQRHAIADRTVGLGGEQQPEGVTFDHLLAGGRAAESLATTRWWWLIVQPIDARQRGAESPGSQQVGIHRENALNSTAATTMPTNYRGTRGPKIDNKAKQAFTR